MMLHPSSRKKSTIPARLGKNSLACKYLPLAIIIATLLIVSSLPARGLLVLWTPDRAINTQIMVAEQSVTMVEARLKSLPAVAQTAWRRQEEKALRQELSALQRALIRIKEETEKHASPAFSLLWHGYGLEPEMGTTLRNATITVARLQQKLSTPVIPDAVLATISDRIRQTRQMIKQLHAQLHAHEEATQSRFLFLWRSSIILVTALFLGLAWHINRRLIRPMNDVRRSAMAIADGDLTRRTPVYGCREIGALAADVNRMADYLTTLVSEKNRLLQNATVLHTAVGEILKEQDIDSLLQKIIDWARELTRARYGAITILDQDGKLEKFLASGLEPATCTAAMQQSPDPPGRQGLLGYLLPQGTPLRLDNIDSHSATTGFPAGYPQITTFLGVPIRAGGKIIGSLYLTDRQDGRAFDENNETMAVCLGNIAAQASSNARTLATEKAVRRNLDALHAFTESVSTARGVDEILASALDHFLADDILQLTNKGGIFLCDPETHSLILRQSRNFSKEQQQGCSRIAYGACLCGMVAESARPCIRSHCRNDPSHTFTYAGLQDHGHVILPIKIRDTRLGVICLYLPAGLQFPQSSFDLLAAMTRVLAIALANALEHEKSRWLASFPEGSPYIVLEYNHQGRLTYCNPRTEQTATELGVSPAAFIPEDFHATIRSLQAENEGCCRLEHTVGGRIFAEYLHHLPEQKIVRIYAFDITETREASLALEKSERLLARAQEIARLGYWEWDVRKNHLTCSDEVYRILAVDPHEFDNTFESFMTRIHPEDTDKVRKAVDETLKKGVPYAVEYRIRTSDCERIVFEQAEVERDSKGNAVRMLGTVQDITERKNTEASLARLGRILDETSNEIYIIDAQTLRFLHVNRGARENLGYSTEELLQMTPLDLKPDFTAESLDSFFAPLRNGSRRVVTCETRHRRKDGSCYPVEIRLQIAATRGPPAFVAIGRDLSERIAREEAEAASQAKSEFLANMSHELRTPLNAIIGFAEALRDGLAGAVNPEQHEYLGDIANSGRHLLALINEILDLAKVEAGRMELDLTEVEVVPMIESCLALFKEKAVKHAITLERDLADDLGTVVCDQRKIKQILYNLISNAVKFTPDGGRVGVRARCRDDKIQVEVWDTGIGISEQDIKRLFQPFTQLDSTLTKKHQGTGLGLALCRRMVEMHGGRIWVESEPGHSSRFFFTLSRKTPGKPPALQKNK